MNKRIIAPLGVTAETLHLGGCHATDEMFLCAGLGNPNAIAKWYELMTPNAII